MKAKDFDKAFDDGEDISPLLDYSKSRRVNEEPKRVNVDFPIWMVNQLDREARRSIGNLNTILPESHMY